MQESACSIDGFADPGGSLSRWAREGWTNTSMYELPHLLLSLAQQVRAGLGVYSVHMDIGQALPDTHDLDLFLLDSEVSLLQLAQALG